MSTLEVPSLEAASDPGRGRSVYFHSIAMPTTRPSESRRGKTHLARCSGHLGGPSVVRRGSCVGRSTRRSGTVGQEPVLDRDRAIRSRPRARPSATASRSSKRAGSRWLTQATWEERRSDVGRFPRSSRYVHQRTACSRKKESAPSRTRGWSVRSRSSSSRRTPFDGVPQSNSATPATRSALGVVEALAGRHQRSVTSRERSMYRAVPGARWAIPGTRLAALRFPRVGGGASAAVSRDLSLVDVAA